MDVPEGSGGSKVWFYYRISPGVRLNWHVPINKKISYFFGPSLSYNFISFEAPAPEDKFNANALGFGAQAGVMFHFGKISLQPFLAINYIKAKYKGGQNVFDSGESDNLTAPKNLDYSGIHLGINFIL